MSLPRKIEDFEEAKINESNLFDPSMGNEEHPLIKYAELYYKATDPIEEQEALEKFKDDEYKLDLINNMDESNVISCYTQGDFTDLCRGPHVETVKVLQTLGKELPPIVALTANNYDGIKEDFIRKGFANYIQKPLNFKELSKVINNTFRKDN